jgi:uncharacterized protein (DUF1330 family)
VTLAIVGAWRDSTRLAGLKPGDLTELPGYDAIIMRAGIGRFDGYYEALTPALEVFEGTPPGSRGVVIVHFPCLDAARRFWRSDEYAGIRKLREGIADFEVLVLPVPQLPK